MDESTLELIHLVVDGSASPGQARELDRILESSAEAREMLESLRSTVRDLGRIPLEEAPPALKARILQEARARAAAVPRVAPFRRRPWILGAVWGLAAAGLLAYVAFTRGPGSSSRPEAQLASGAMVDLDRRTWPLVSQQAAQDLEGVPATLTLWRKGDRLLLQTDLRVGRAKALTLKWDAERLALLEPPKVQGHLPESARAGELVIPPEISGPVSLVLGPKEGATGPGAITLEEEGREILQTHVRIR